MNTEELANVTLEHLRHIRARVDKIADDVDDIKLRMSNLERQYGEREARGSSG